MNKYFDKRFPLYCHLGTQKFLDWGRWVRLFVLSRHINDYGNIIDEFLTDEEIGQEMGGN